MNKWLKKILEQLKQSSEFEQLHHFTVMQPLKPGKVKTYALSQSNYIHYHYNKVIWLSPMSSTLKNYMC